MVCQKEVGRTPQAFLSFSITNPFIASHFFGVMRRRACCYAAFDSAAWHLAAANIAEFKRHLLVYSDTWYSYWVKTCWRIWCIFTHFVRGFPIYFRRLIRYIYTPYYLGHAGNHTNALVLLFRL